MQKILQMNFPARLVFGNHTIAQMVDELVHLKSSRVAIVTIPALQSSIKPMLNQLAAAGIEVLKDEGISAEPYFADLHRLVEYFTPFRPDTVLGIGGGSVLDIAKLLAALLDNEQTLQDVVGNGLLKKRTKKLICVPATSGTGSEVSPNAILIDDADGQKKGIISPFLVPDLVLVDPVLTSSVPASVTAATGLDALTHCIEAYTNKFSNPFIDVFALEGIRLIAANLVDAVLDGNNLEAREKLSMGSMNGGFCLGPVNTAAVHALAYPLGTMYHVAHGLSNAVLLPHVMEFNIPAAVEKYAAVAGALGVAPDADLHAMALKGILRIREIMQACNVPDNLRSMGVTQTDIPILAQEAMKIQRLLKNNPRTVLLEDAINIYEKTC
jgi:alcohol dehydrogenase class IV